MGGVSFHRGHFCLDCPSQQSALMPFFTGMKPTKPSASVTWGYPRTEHTESNGSGTLFQVHSACEQVLRYEADCDARARLCEASASAWECCSDLQPAPSRLGMKMCHIPFHAPFQIPFSPSFTAHLWGEQCCYFYGVRAWTCCQRRKVVLSRILLYLSRLPICWRRLETY